MKKLYVFMLSMLLLTASAMGAILQVGPGQTYTTLQAAITAASTGDVIELLDDITEGIVVINKDLTLDGKGFTLTSTSANYGISIQSTDVIIQNITVDGAETYGIHQSPGSDDLIIQYTTVKNGGGSGFAMNCSDNILLKSITSSDNTNGNGVSITNCTNVTIDGITTSGNGWTSWQSGIGIFSNAGTCTPDITDGVTLTGAVSISEAVGVYEQVLTGSISNVTLPATFSYYLGIGTDNKHYHTSKQNALDAAETYLNADITLKPALYVKEVATGNFIVDAFTSVEMSIQAAIDAATAGDVIEVAAGTYVENILIDKKVNIIGAGSDADPLFNTIITQNTSGAGDTKVGVVQLNASGSNGDPLLLQNLRIEPDGMAGISVGRFTEATGLNVSHLALSNVYVVGTENADPCGEQERGLYVDLTSSLSNVNISNCAFNKLDYGWYLQKAVSADASNVTQIAVSNTEFKDNIAKGLYAEKLDNASFINCEISNNGDLTWGNSCTYFKPWLSGIDINLKAGNYTNITIDNCTFTGNAIGEAKEGVALTVKARDDGATYGAFPATLSNVIIQNSTITGNERGIRIGEPGKGNNSPTNVNISACTIHSNRQQYSGVDGTFYGDIINQTANDDEVSVAGYGDILSGQAVWYVNNGQSIQGTIDAANAGDVIEVAAGTYVEDILIEIPLTLNGANADIVPGAANRGSESIIQPFTSGRAPIHLGDGTDNVTINGFEITASMSTNAIYCGVNGPSYLDIKFNYIHDIGTGAIGGNVYAINYRGGANSPTNVNISDNLINEVFNTTITADKSSAAIWLGQSSATGTVSNVTIERNTISNIKSDIANKVFEPSPYSDVGKYTASGIYIGIGWKNVGNVSGAIISDNTITNVIGGMAYAIQLSGNTPSIDISNNSISNISSPTSPNYSYGIGVPSTNTGTGILINNNSITNLQYGVTNGTTNSIDATCNWWGQATGPGTGQITGNVNYTPWLASNDISNPVCLGGAPNVFLDENFDNPVELFDANVSQRWYVDRYAPAAFESYNFNGENVLKIATGPGSANRGSQSSTFYNTHGRKFNQGGLGAVSLAGDLYIPADWASNHRRSGMWATMQDASGTITNYPILSFRNVDGTNPTFSYWTSATGWNDVSNPILYDNWNNFEYKLWNGIAYYYINGELVGTEADASSIEIQNVIIQIYNFDNPDLPANEQDPGSNYVAYWDNISTTTGGPVHNVSQNTYHPTIQSAIDAAIAGDVIEVAAGTYEEQLHITTNNLTIRGDDKATTSILSPTNLTEYFNSGSNDNYPVVFIDGVAQCTIENFTIDGDGRGNANYRYQGIGFWNAGGTVDNVDVKGIMETPFSGSQHGVAVYAYNNTPAINYTLTLSNMTIEDYQKNAMALNGSDNLTANLDNITTIGAGSTTVTAQNGIQFWGVGGSISNSSVTGNIYAGTGWSSAGILLYQCQNVIDIHNTTITNNFYGLDVNDAKGSIANSSITNTDVDSKHGLVIRNGNQSVIGFTMDDVAISGNNNAGAYGIAIYCYDSDITSSIGSSDVSDWQYGIVVYEMGLGEINHTTQTTKLTNNGVSLYSNAVNQQDASLNYWGSAQPDFNALISGDVEFCPYYTDELMTNESCPEVSNTTQGTTHYTLQDAVDDASTNDVIEITAGGTFDGITLNTGQSITLINSSGEEVIIRGASPALTVTSGTMTVAGITYTTSTDDPTILINGGNLVLRNCIIEESTGFTQSCIKIESGTLDAGLSADHGENTFITDGNAKAIINQTATPADAIGNYWGTLVYYDIANLMTGPVNFDPWCNDDFSVCGYSTNTAGPITTIEGTLEDAGTNPVIVPITVENFTDVDAISIRITYDPTTVTLQDVTSTLPGYGGTLPGGLSAWYSTTGTSIIIGWIDPSATGVSLADGSVLFNLHFTFNNTTTGGTSTLEFDDSDDTYCEYQNALIQAPFADDPQANYWIDGWVSNLSVSFTRAYDPTVEITAVPAGGESPYAYNWAGPGTQTATTATITPTDGYGTYTVTVTDDLGAFVVGTYSYGRVHNINTYLDYMDIQVAIDASETVNGHTLTADAGTYAENIDVDKQLTIIGDGATTTTISAGAGIGVEISVDNVTLDGFTVSHASVTSELDQGVQFFLCNGGTVQNCLLTSNSFGVMLYDAGDCDILDNEFAYNAVGIYLEGTTDGLGNNDGGTNGPFYSLSLNNTISGNNIHHSVLVGGDGGQGIYLDAACEGNTITANTITLSEGPGYFAWKASGNTITNNTITSNGSEGIQLMGSSDNTITGNLIDQNETGIWMRSPAENVENNLISDNDVTNNTVGILMEDDFIPNNYAGKLLNNTIQDNNISGNTSYGLQVLNVDASSFTDVDADMNWWGDATGPAHSTNPCGLGNAVTDYVDFSPWYYQSGMTTLNGLPVVTLSDVQDISTITNTPVIVSVSADYTAEDLSDYDPDVKVDNLLSSTVAFPANAEVISVTYDQGSGATEVLTAPYDLSGKTTVYLSEILGATTGNPLAGHDGLTTVWQVTIAGMDVATTYAITMDAVSYILQHSTCDNELGTDDFSITYADVAFSYTPETPVCYLDPANVEFTETYPLVANNGGDRILNDSKWEFYTDAAMNSPFDLPIGATITAGEVDGSGDFIWSKTSILTTAVSQFYGSAVVTEQGDPSVYTNGQLIALERAAATNNWKAVLEGVPAGTYYIKVKNLAMLDPDGQQYTASTGPHGTFTEFVYDDQSFMVLVNACGLSGALSYYNVANSPLPNETIELWKDGASVASVSSDAAGDFFFPALNAGTYEIRPQTTLPVKSINATDAAQVNYWQVNAPSSYIEKVRFMAGDVNRLDATDLTPDVLGSFEAYRILSYFVTNGSQGWMNAPDWSFWKANDQIRANNWTDGRYPTVEVSDESVTQNVYGLITGDFNRSYVPAAKKSASNTLFLNDGKNILVGSATQVSLPFTLQGRLEAGAFSVILEYPAHLVEVVGVNLTNNPNAPILYTAENGVLRIAWMNPQPLYLNAGDALFTLDLLTAENLGSNSVIRFSLAADPMNEVADGQSKVVEDVQLFADVLSNSFLGMGENEHSIGINIFPNPVREQATLVYHLPENGNVKLELTNALGQTVQVLCDEMQTTGTHSIQLNANHLNAGVYFVNITLETTTETLRNSRRLILQ